MRHHVLFMESDPYFAYAQTRRFVKGGFYQRAGAAVDNSAPLYAHCKCIRLVKYRFSITSCQYATAGVDAQRIRHALATGGIYFHAQNRLGTA